MSSLNSYFTVCVSANNGQIANASRRIQIAGILGVVKLIVGPYIIVIKEKKLVGKISGHDIWQLIKIDMISLPKTKLHLNDTQVKTYFYSLTDINYSL